MRGLDHDGRDCRLDAVEQPGDQGNITKGDVDPGQGDQDEQRGQHEERTCHDAAPGPVHQPADIGGELLRLGAGQHHAVVERVQETFLGNPVAFLHQLGVHDGDLPGRTAKADEAELEPEPQRLAEGNTVRGSGWGRSGH